MVPDLAPPVIFAALAWWLSTGLILFLISLPRRTYVWTAIGATALLGLATGLVMLLRDRTGVEAAYAGFGAGLLLWAWHEVMFLTGFITGSSRRACPEGSAGFRRFRAALGAVFHHEIVIALHACLILGLSWGGANQFACWTFLILWGARICAKLVVFSGAPNIIDHFLPVHLDYLKTYFSRRAPGGVFIGAIIVITSLSVWLALRAAEHAPGTFEFAGFVLLTAITILALIEHWALVLPWRDPSLWGWALKPSERISTVSHERTKKRGDP